METGNSFTERFRRRAEVEARAFKGVLIETVRTIFGFSTLPLKQRHFFTRAGELRVRYIAMVVVLFLSFISAFSVTEQKPMNLQVSEAPVLSDFETGFEDQPIEVPPEIVEVDPFEGDPFAQSHTGVPRIPHKKPMVAQAENWTRSLLVQSGDTVSDILQIAGLGVDESKLAERTLRPYITTRDLVSGRSVQVDLSRKAGVTAVEFPESDLSSIVLTRGQGGFTVKRATKQLVRELRAVRVTVHGALYNDLIRAGVPHGMIIELIKAYSYSIDFARDIWDGDRIEILYDVDRTDDGKFVRGNDLLMARMTLRGKSTEMIRFTRTGGKPEFLDGLGKTVRRAFLQTPIDGARMTSGFGLRRHPIQGYTKMHKGVDFGAPTGTPIFAAGDGVIERAGWVNGYGNYIKLKHSAMYGTAYAHMSRFARGVSTGTRVRQGQVIGYVGSTGNSTGPHLHFELVKNGVQINPRAVANISMGDAVNAADLKRFKAQKADYSVQFAKLLGDPVGKASRAAPPKSDAIETKAVKATPAKKTAPAKKDTKKSKEKPKKKGH